MAISNSIILRNLSGHVGKQLVFKQYGDKTVVSKYPDMRKRKLSEKQKKINSIMDDANYTARKTMADEELRNKALLRLNVTRNKLYTALIREYFKSALANGLK